MKRLANITTTPSKMSHTGHAETSDPVAGIVDETVREEWDCFFAIDVDVVTVCDVLVAVLVGAIDVAVVDGIVVVVVVVVVVGYAPVVVKPKMKASDEPNEVNDAPAPAGSKSDTASKVPVV